MNKTDTASVEELYMTISEVEDYLSINRARVYQLIKAGHIEQMKGSVLNAASVEAYKARRGDKKGGRYPKEG